MKTNNLLRAGLLGALMMGSLGLAVRSPMLQAQARVPVERVADGEVTDKGGSALAGAVVYLRDTKSNSVKTCIAGAGGRFHFGQLSQNTDYELWAAVEGSKSKTKSISSFDTKNNYDFTLKVDR